LHFHVPHRPQGPEAAPGQHAVSTQVLLHRIAFPAHLQAPVLGSQVWLPGHILGAPGLQTPALHVSPVVHMLPSLQAAVLLIVTQPFSGSQLVVVHGLLVAAQAMPAPGAHLPARHTSMPLHTFLSSQSLSVVHWAGGPASATCEPPVPPLPAVLLPAEPPVAEASTLLLPPGPLVLSPPMPALPPLADESDPEMTSFAVNCAPHAASRLLPRAAVSPNRTM
jgi:hypothetical protein